MECPPMAASSASRPCWWVSSSPLRWSMLMCLLSRYPDPGVEDGVEDVRHQVGDQRQDPGHRQDAGSEGDVGHRYGLEEELAHAEIGRASCREREEEE